MGDTLRCNICGLVSCSSYEMRDHMYDAHGAAELDNYTRYPIGTPIPKQLGRRVDLGGGLFMGFGAEAK